MAELAGAVVKQVMTNGWVRGVLMGGGFAYAHEKNKSILHYPIIFCFANPYAGYQLFKNREHIKDYVLQNKSN